MPYLIISIFSQLENNDSNNIDILHCLMGECIVTEGASKP